MINKEDSFIGSNFDTPKGGVITVVGISTSPRVDGHKKYLCECSICSKDTELFPDLFESVKRGLTGSKSRKPRVICGCTKFKWSESQQVILVKREAALRGYTFSGWSGVFKGAKTKLHLYNPVTGNSWDSTTINNFNEGNGDPTFRMNGGNGYYPERVEETDYLYVLDFLTPYKVGRTFNLKERRKNLKTEAHLPNKPEVLQLYTATHQTIYDTEQAIHAELRERGFQHYCNWTNECFTKDCWHILQEILEDYVSSGTLERVT